MTKFVQVSEPVTNPALGAYQWMRDKYAGITPLRRQGAGVDIRPIGRRHRKHELIVEIPSTVPGEAPAYAARLYDTNCVTYYPDGRVVVASDGWESVLTAQFIHRYVPAGCGALRTRNRIWVFDSFGVKYPLAKKFGGKAFAFYLHHVPTTPNTYTNANTNTTSNLRPRIVPVEETHIMQERVDRCKSKEYHAKLKPMLDCFRTMLELSDGWVMHETVKAFYPIAVQRAEDDCNNSIPNALRRYDYTGEFRALGNTLPYDSTVARIVPWGANAYLDPHRRNRPDTKMSTAQLAQEFVDWLCTREVDEFPAVMCRLAEAVLGYTSWYSAPSTEVARLAEEFHGAVGNQAWPVRFYDVRLDFDRLKRYVYNAVASLPDIKKQVAIKPDGKFRSNTI